MKVFVYSKKSSKQIASINHVKEVSEDRKNGRIFFITETGERLDFDIKNVKSTIYQN